MTYEKYYVKFKASQCFGIPHNDHNAKNIMYSSIVYRCITYNHKILYLN